MLIRLLSILVIFSFVCTSILEVRAGNNSLKTSESSTYKKDNSQGKSIYVFGIINNNDCKDDDCPVSQACTSCVCPCGSICFINSKSNLLCDISSLHSKLDWYTRNFYQSPFLDPALKPPLFS